MGQTTSDVTKMVGNCGVFLLTICLLHATTTTTALPHFTNDWVAVISGGVDHAHTVATRNGFDLIRSMPDFPDHYLLRKRDIPQRSKRNAEVHTRQLTEDAQVQWAEQQIARTRVKRGSEDDDISEANSGFNDPLFLNQWYIGKKQETGRDTQQSVVTMNMNVQGAWDKGYSGQQVVVAILDDGLEHSNKDIQANYDPCASTDLNDHDSDPMPRYDPTNENKHGTRCAGEVAMVANNGVCGVGIAFNCSIGGVRMLDGPVTDSTEGMALCFNHTYIQVYSSSWGPSDDGETVEGPAKLAAEAIEKGIKYGRGGKGVIYVWASGNGGYYEDNCNCDGYTSSIYTLSVSSATEHGLAPWYAERCSSTMATTYSSGFRSEQQVVSADLHDGCTKHHTGTSASAPMAAGIIALVLEANPSLTWRDVQHLVVLTSKAGALSSEEGWYQNGAGLCVNPAFGFGLLDAEALVTQAVDWVQVPEASVCRVDVANTTHLPLTVRNGKMVEIQIETDGCKGQPNEVNYLEHVQFVLTMTYSLRGALSITVISPSGTKTVLMSPRKKDLSYQGFRSWPLMSVHTWGEQPAGIWRFQIEDKTDRKYNRGQLKALKMILYGTKTAPEYRNITSFSCDLRESEDNAGEGDQLADEADNNKIATRSLIEKVLEREKDSTNV